MVTAVAVQLTELCGPGCLICSGAGRSVNPRSLSLDTFERILLEARAIGIRRVVLTGGEPLVHEDINGVMDLVETMDVEVEVVATGYRLEQREPALKRLGSRLVRLSTELLGGTASTHEKTNGRSGSFQEARAVLEVAHELKVPSRVRLIPTPEALREIDGFRAAVARFAPEIVIDRSSSHLPRSVFELRGDAEERCGDAANEIVAALAASGRLYPCLAAIGAQAVDEKEAPLLEVRLREALAAVARLEGRRCQQCRAGAASALAALGRAV
jgi:organic radical activating enzyme